MRCEGSCNQTFRNGERVYAVRARVIIIRDGKEQLTDVEGYYCVLCAHHHAPIALSALTAVRSR
jgi:hypothetical protein